MIYVFRFKVKVNNGDGVGVVRFGLAMGENYEDAMKQIEQYYDPTLLSVEKLAMIADSGVVVEFPDGTEDIIDKIEEVFVW